MAKQKSLRPPKGIVFNRSELSHCFGVAKTTVDSWVKRGCPIRFQGGKGIASEFDTAEVVIWLINNRSG